MIDFKNYNYPKSFPEVISFLVTNKCVCRCKHCFNWYESNETGAIGNLKKHDLTLDEIERIFKGFEPIEYLYIGGGEPFIRQDLFEILEIIHIYSKPKVINISTNGQLTDNTVNTLQKLLSKYQDVKYIVKISIDAIGREHDEIRQRQGAFERAIETYNYLHSLKKKAKHLHIGINTVFSALNQDRIFDIYEYLKHLSPKPDCMAQLFIRSQPREQKSKENLDIEKYHQWTEMYARDMLRGEFEDDFLVKVAIILMYDYIYKTLKEEQQQIHCYAGISGAVIDNEGMLGPCEHKPAYGSLRENNYDFKRIWHSELTQRMRSESYSHCFCTNEPQWWHPSVAYNRAVMEEGRQLLQKIFSVTEGII